MNRLVKYIIWGNLAVLTVLAFVYAHLMIAPGPLIQGHEKLQGDCFACHTPFLGAQPDKCVECHKVEEIGIRKTTGELVKRKTGGGGVGFHQKLPRNECVACHSDHVGVIIYRDSQAFSHDILDPGTLKQCVACHVKPTDELHKPEKMNQCTDCHTTTKWKPAKFKHDMLTKAELRKCESCHLSKRPNDEFHRVASQRCGNCHRTDDWENTKQDKSYYESLPTFRSLPRTLAPRVEPQTQTPSGTQRAPDEFQPMRPSIQAPQPSTRPSTPGPFDPVGPSSSPFTPSEPSRRDAPSQFQPVAPPSNSVNPNSPFAPVDPNSPW